MRFLWDKEKGLRDLKTLGGNTGLAISQIFRIAQIGYVALSMFTATGVVNGVLPLTLTAHLSPDSTVTQQL